MIVSEFKDGQGLGNQLWMYVVTRSVALELNFDFGFQNIEKFKGLGFLNLDFGKQCLKEIGTDNLSIEHQLPIDIKNIFTENYILDINTKLDISPLDSRIWQIKDSTKLFGNFQSEGYYIRNLDLVSSWLRISKHVAFPDFDPENECLINFRGGEYRHMKNILLPINYWLDAQRIMRKINSKMKFVVVTDDYALARRFFPKARILRQGMASDYLSLNLAKYIILSNSSFAWFPVRTNANEPVVFAPKFWWGYNQDIWSCGETKCNSWNYLDKQGKIELAVNYNSKLSHFSENLQKKRTNLLVSRNIFNFIHKLFYSDQIRRRWRSLIWLEVISRKILNGIIYRVKLRIAKLMRKIIPFSRYEIPWPFVKEESRHKVVDLFYFNDEIELAKLRFRYLYEYVDEFVVLESRQTFSGKEKTLVFRENLNEFEQYRNKIRLVEVPVTSLNRNELESTLLDEKTDEVTRRCIAFTLNEKFTVPQVHSTHWLIEYFQKEFAQFALKEGNLLDTVIVSDVDEFWNVRKLRRPKYKDVLIFKQTPLVYFLNLKSKEHWHNWTGSVVATRGRWLDEGINNLRIHNRIFRRVILKGGWHFTFQGGKERIINKLNSYGHQELNNKNILRSIEMGSYTRHDFRLPKNKLKLWPQRKWPEFLKDARIEYRKWFITNSDAEK